MMNPRNFFDAFVLPTLEEWRLAPFDMRRATLAICQLDVLAERTIRHANPDIAERDFRIERERLGIIEPTLALVRDIHDAHKHGPLARRTAIITSDQRPEVYSTGGGIGGGPIGGASIGGSISEFVICSDDGTRHDLRTVINRTVTYWSAELSRLGL